MDDLEDFESGRLLLNSAEEAINEFNLQHRAFIERSTYTVYSRIDDETREQVYSFRFSERIPKTMRVLATHVVSHIKHGLDQAFCDAAFACGRPSRSGMHFPIAGSLEDFNREVTRRCHKVRTELIAFVRKLEPYYGGDSALYRFLSLAGPSKHQRVLQITISARTSMLMGRRDMTFIPACRLGSLGWSESRNELDFMRTAIGQKYEADFSPRVEVVIQVGEAPLSGEASAIFSKMLGKTRSIVDGLEAETIRVKAIIETEQGSPHGKSPQPPG